MDAQLILRPLSASGPARPAMRVVLYTHYRTTVVAILHDLDLEEFVDDISANPLILSFPDETRFFEMIQYVSAWIAGAVIYNGGVYR